ncbi:hypothetical protein BGW36DRAFT_390781 [Talaromyces proteolyticus]|uniref:Secreted protein n=1 Tax=Talaromyces proteolyticus TaxID=1131652 RepID=A0AAD4KES4_9EURO|nr:uncharacterized protein BGW36DRAFT_390781 [Talaromyces proteolyticus]KAH8689397.1 hypothetical protein BGW36DRAFT_390781 [Talaromyces proteolyticus]
MIHLWAYLGFVQTAASGTSEIQAWQYLAYAMQRQRSSSRCDAGSWLDRSGCLAACMRLSHLSYLLYYYRVYGPLH